MTGQDATDDAFIFCEQIGETLQGSIWRALQQDTKQQVVIKATNKTLHQESVILDNNGEKYAIYENIMKEMNILRYLTIDKNAPNSIVKYIDFCQNESDYFLIMEDGGHSLFHFAGRGHQLILHQKIDVFEWHKIIKVILKQIIECIDYIHSKNVAHFDISLENFLINDVNIITTKDNKLKLCLKEIEIKICDFGLSEIFESNVLNECKSNKFCGKIIYESPEIIKRETFDAKSNDIWGIGICLFILLIGFPPWIIANQYDSRFAELMKPNGIKNILKKWNKLYLVNDDLIELLQLILQPQSKRATIEDIKQCSFLK